MEVTYKAHSEDLLDWADTQADLSLRSFYWFCHVIAHFVNHYCSYFFKNILDAHCCFPYTAKAVFFPRIYNKNILLWFGQVHKILVEKMRLELARAFAARTYKVWM